LVKLVYQETKIQGETMKNCSKKICFVFLIFLSVFSIPIRSIFCFYVPPIRSPSFSKNSSINLHDYFSLDNPPSHKHVIITNPIALQHVANEALNQLQKNDKIVSSQIFSKEILSTNKVRETLKFIVSSIEQDSKTGKFRTLDSNFIKQNFGFIKWKGDSYNAKKNGISTVKNGKIRLTNYVAYFVDGQYKKTKKYNHALYELKNSKQKVCYTKQQIMDGILEHDINSNLVRPLVWLTREGVEDAILQGTIFVKMPDNKTRAFNTNRSNGFKHNKKIRDKNKQKTYWFVKEIVQASKLWNECNIRKNIVFAGDMNNIGFGKIIALYYKNRLSGKEEMRIGILADTGSAFFSNLYQLDLFSGILYKKSDLKANLLQFPDSANAYVLYKKRNYE
jgi:hypothetical protein